MLTEDKVIEIFVMADKFCKIFNAMLRRRGLDVPKDGRVHDYNSDCRLSQAGRYYHVIILDMSNH